MKKVGEECGQEEGYREKSVMLLNLHHEPYEIHSLYINTMKSKAKVLKSIHFHYIHFS